MTNINAFFFGDNIFCTAVGGDANLLRVSFIIFSWQIQRKNIYFCLLLLPVFSFHWDLNHVDEYIFINFIIWTLNIKMFELGKCNIFVISSHLKIHWLLKIAETLLFMAKEIKKCCSKSFYLNKLLAFDEFNSLSQNEYYN